MTFPQAPLLNPWSHGEEVDEVDLYDRITDKLNKLAAAVPLGSYGSVYDGTAITLASAGGTTATYYPCGPGLVVNLAAQRRIQAFARVSVNPAAAVAGKYALHIGYAIGVASPPVFGTANPTVTNYPLYANSAAVTAAVGIVTFGDVLLAAGSYCFFPWLGRFSGGSATDTVSNTYISVLDVGSA